MGWFVVILDRGQRVMRHERETGDITELAALAPGHGLSMAG